MKIFAMSIVFILAQFSFALAEEIVMNKEGKSVLLKDDGTWELISSEGEDGKVVFMIKKGTNYQKSYPRKDDMEEFSHYDNNVGCKYMITVKNNTKFKVKVESFKIATNNSKLFSDRMTRDSLIQFRQVIKPGETFTGKGNYKVGGPRMWADKTKELPTEKQKKKWISKYGCEAQKGSIFLKPGHGKFMTFSKDSGVAEDAMQNFVIGSSNGMYPIKKDIEF